MKVEIIKCLQDNYSYLLINEINQNACVIDPSESRPIIDFVEKKNINLKFILNTHHHHDHVGGNSELKKKYRAKVIGFKNDKDRIPEIDIFVENNKTWTNEDFEAKIIHIPGHTSGHICFYFSKDKIAFTGDTLFSLGCGRIFEGTYEQMFASLNKLKKLPIDTKVYCGHEYTLKNSIFCSQHEKNNKNFEKKIFEIEDKLKNNLPTIPSTIGEELACNIFLRAKNIEDFSKLRDLKDNF